MRSLFLFLLCCIVFLRISFAYLSVAAASLALPTNKHTQRKKKQGEAKKNPTRGTRKTPESKGKILKTREAHSINWKAQQRTNRTKSILKRAHTEIIIRKRQPLRKHKLDSHSLFFC
jgi:flagellar biosynthesis component FlhA